MLNGYDESDDEEPVKIENEKQIEIKPLMMSVKFSHREILPYDVDQDDFETWFTAFETKAI